MSFGKKVQAADSSRRKTPVLKGAVWDRPLQELSSFLEPEPALVGLSGGRDSVALLDLLVRAGKNSLIVCHLNHGFRGRESGHDAAFVRRLAGKHNLICEIEKINVAAYAKAKRLSFETAAREVRYDFFHRIAEKHSVNRIYLAHHADDQAETILANLCRGSSLRGLAGMKRKSVAQGGLILLRPLLQWRRADIDAYVAEHRLKYREDSSNTSLKYRRNRLRHQVLPLLNEVFDRDVAPLLARMGAQAERDDECLRSQARLLLEKPGVLSDDPGLTLSVEIKNSHPAVLSRLLTIWLRENLVLHGIENEDIESAIVMLRPGGPAKINLPGDKYLRRRAGKLFVE